MKHPSAPSHIRGNGTNSSVIGEMARLIESFDWSQSPLGPMLQWPQSLKTALSMCLRSRFQLGIYWGPDLVFLYNDAEREVIGSLHPHALGKPARDILVDNVGDGPANVVPGVRIGRGDLVGRSAADD